MRWCWEKLSGGVLGDRRCGRLALKKMEDVMVTVEASPAGVGGIRQLEHEC